MACPCCGKDKISGHLVRKLQIGVNLLGMPINITSGYRCPKHNVVVGGSPTSSHLLGLAADFAVVMPTYRYQIIPLLTAQFARILLYNTFIHVDIDSDKTQQIIEIYN